MEDVTATTPLVDGELCLLTDENAIRILVNGVEKFLANDWLVGNGRASNSILAKQILGSGELLRGSSVITIDTELLSSFDLVIDWLSVGGKQTRSILCDENASQLYALALYFGLDDLLGTIEDEKRKRDKEVEDQERQERLEAERRRLRELREQRLRNHFTHRIQAFRERVERESQEFRERSLRERRLSLERMERQRRNHAQRVRDLTLRAREHANRGHVLRMERSQNIQALLGGDEGNAQEVGLQRRQEINALQERDIEARTQARQLREQAQASLRLQRPREQGQEPRENAQDQSVRERSQISLESRMLELRQRRQLQESLLRRQREQVQANAVLQRRRQQVQQRLQRQRENYEWRIDYLRRSQNEQRFSRATLMQARTNQLQEQVERLRERSNHEVAASRRRLDEQAGRSRVLLQNLEEMLELSRRLRTDAP